MRSIWMQVLKSSHHWAASAYLYVRGSLCYGWFEALEHSPAPNENAVCPVKQLIGISVHEKTQ